MTDAETGLFRLAWLPDDETLLRVEAGVIALQGMEMEDNTMVGFKPPSLTSLRCDVLKKAGDLPGEPQFARAESSSAHSAPLRATAEATGAAASSETISGIIEGTSNSDQSEGEKFVKAASDTVVQRKDDDEDDLQVVRESLQL